MARTSGPIVAFMQITVFIATVQIAYGEYLGKPLGKLSELHHGVSGEVYAIDARTLHLKDFTYDGQGPAAYFYAGSSRVPGSGGFRLRDENGNPDVIRRYRKESVTLTLPEGKTLTNIKWFSVWCEEFAVNFGDVKIPRNFDYPRPRKIDALKGVHAISSDNIVVVDAQTLLIPNLSYDGEAPDAKFWVGKGPKPSPHGVRVPDENGKEVPLRRYDQKTVVLTLPGDITIFDIDYFGIWCEAFTVDFGHILIPKNLNVPPSLKMLHISPQSKLNCEVLHDDLAFEVRWAIAGDSIVLQLVAKLEDREYMSFGISGDSSKTTMIGGDVAVAWVDKETLKGHAVDYYLGDKSQCSGPSGSCPDEKLGGTNNIRQLNAAVVNGYSIVTYQRPIKASGNEDRDILTNEAQAIIWAIGPLNQRNEVSFHSHWTKKDVLFDFGRQPKWNCPMPETEQPAMKSSTYNKVEVQSNGNISPSTSSRTRIQQKRKGEISKDALDNITKDSENNVSRTRLRGQSNHQVPTPAPVVKRDAWNIPPIQCYEPEDGVYYAQMGPTGGKRGYPAITGHVGWGISWYINGLLIPEINLVRGKTYTFVVEGGLDSEVPAKYHPFYITDDPIGGYEYKTPAEREKVKIFAGAKQEADGTIIPTGVGRLCHWTHQGDLDADDYESFGAYQRTLELKCDHGEPGVIQFTPDKNTPDTVYYQCFTHRYLGWKINILDSCDSEPAGSEVQPSVTSSSDDLDNSPSIRVESRVLAPNSVINEYNKDASSAGFKEVPQYPTESLATAPTSNSLVSLPQQAVLTTDLSKSLENKTISNSTNIPTPEKESAQKDLGVSSNGQTTIMKKMSAEHVDEPLFSQKVFPLDTTILLTPPNLLSRPSKIMVPHPFSSSANQRPSYFLYKKPVYASLLKTPLNTLYKKPQHISVMPSFIRPPPLLLLKRPVPDMLIQKVSPNIMFTNPHPQVELSPQQISTEKEPQGTTESTYSTLIQTVPSKIQYNAYRQAINTGFKPESIVIESGFKPIISKEIQNRNEEGPELKYESEVGIFDMSKQNNKTSYNNPLFVGHKNKVYKNSKPKHNGVVLIIKHTRQERSEALPLEDEIAESAEQIDGFYLPPPDSKEAPIEHIVKPSNIDVAPGTVVTYDGKKVSGASLTVRLTDRGSTVLDSKTSKATELIKLSPQFGPFRGDLPPLNPKFITAIAPQLQHQGVLNRDLESPPPSYLPSQPYPPRSPIKLLPVKPLEENTQDNQPSLVLRSKRAAHHTPEHTAEQNSETMRSQIQNEKSASSRSLNVLLLPYAYFCILFYQLMHF